MGRGTQDRMFSKSPLTREEEIEVAKQILSPDPDVSGRAVEKMVLHNARFVKDLVYYLLPPGDQREDDLIQDGLLGLCEAANRYDYRKQSGRFITYAKSWIEGRIRRGFAAITPIGDTDYMDHPWWEHAADVADIRDPSLQPDWPAELASSMESMKKALRRLKPSQALVLAMRYGLGGNEQMTQESIAMKMGIDQARICRIEQEAIGKMREIMNENESD